jgi:hypothetical protein
MNKIHQCNIKEIIETFDIDSLSIQSKFKSRNTGKITAINFLISFFSLILGKCYSQRQWALAISIISNKEISFQAISKRLNFKTLQLVKSIISAAIVKNASLKSCINEVYESKSIFNRILVEDSTCVKLPPSLFSAFPGSATKFGQSAVARVQLCVDILNGDYINYGLTSFRDHDATYSSNILAYLKPNDLVLRDLGYSSNKIFNQIAGMKAFYIARFKVNSSIYSADNKRSVDIFKKLKSIERKGLTYFESDYILGGNQQLKTRVIFLKLTPQQIEKRLKKRKRNGNRNKNTTPKFNYLQTWNILITNITKDTYSGQEIYKLYSLRWHIELIFKTWKSYIDLDSVFKSCYGPNRIKPELLLYLSLSFIVVIVNPQFKRYQRLIYEKFNLYLSPIKFIKSLLNNHIEFSQNCSDLALQLVRKNCCYDRRIDKINIFEKIIYI